MHISENGLHLIEGFEGWSSCPYWDRYGGVWTRGYGETEGIGPNSRCITQAFGEANLRYRMENFYEYAIRGLGVALTQNQWDALCSFIWNVGPGAIQGTALGHYLKAREWTAAANDMLVYDHAGGVVLEGLRRRREAERHLFLTADGTQGSNNGQVLMPFEAVAVRRYDALNRNRSRHPVAWRRERNLLVRYRKAIWWAAVQGVIMGTDKHTEKGWHVNRRAQRYNVLWSRTK